MSIRPIAVLTCRIGVGLAVLFAAGGCRTASHDAPSVRLRDGAGDPTRRMKMGPPPPGYIRILGESVPNWKPSDMLGAARATAATLTWAPLGPRPILDEYWSGNDDASGRVVSIAPHPTDPDTVYIASASGGVWKTTDAGQLWVPLTDALSNLNHGCVAIDPSNPNVVYAGTGEYTTRTDGDGLFRSADGGATWVRIATTAQVGSRCSGVIVDPSNSSIIHVSGNNGYARTDNGGAAWTTYLSGSASSLALNASNPSIVYVGRHSDGVYRSTNGGNAWTKLSSVLPTTGVNRVLVAVASSNPSTLYTAMIDGSSGLRGMYKSADGGDNWTELTNTPNFPYPQGWYDAFIGVDPTNENTIYAGGVFPTYAVAGVIKSTDGGNNWTDITFGAGGGQLHPDQHTIAFGPTGTMWVGNDGGVWKSENGGQAWINTNATLTVTQNYNIALHPTDPAQVMGGTQDNGTVAREADVEEWPQIVAGDGGFLAYDSSDPTRRYTTYVRLTVFRLDGVFFADITGPWEAAGDPANFIAPLVMDPNDPHTLLGGTNRVWRTHNAHTSADWTAISGTSVAAGGTLNAIAVGEGLSDTIYTGSTTGRVYVTTDAVLWQNRSTGLPGGQISDISLDPNDPATAYVAYHNTSGPRVLRTDDHGSTWTDVTGDLPGGVSARALAVNWLSDPPQVYIGSGAGVYHSLTGGTGWVRDSIGLPNVNIGDLLIDPANLTITAGTYGRGAWRADLLTECNPNSPPGECCSNSGPPQLDPLVPDDGFGARNRYISVVSTQSERSAVRVTLSGLPAPFDIYDGVTMWVGPPFEVSENAGKTNPADAPGSGTFWAASLQCESYYTNWSAFPVVHVYDETIVPRGVYDLQVIGESCQEALESSFSPPLMVTQSEWGDVISDCGTTPCGPPDGVINVTSDVTAVLNKFKNLAGAPIKARSDLDFGLPDQKVNISDVTNCLEAFGGFDYPFDPGSAPPPCP